MDQPAQIKVVGTSAAREVDELLDTVAGNRRTGPLSVLQVGARIAPVNKAERNWRHLVDTKYGKRARFVGLDIEAGDNVDLVFDICADAAALDKALGRTRFDLIVCEHVLEHVRAPWQAAATIQTLLAPGGHVLVAVPWVHAHHARPDDYWRMSFAGIALLFEALDVVGLFYTGTGAGLDVAYRVTRGDALELSPAMGAVEQGLFQLTLDHAENKDLLERQPGQRLPLSRAYMPAMLVNVVARKPRQSAS
ncbi:methyltransferase domain-containing protein [Reyranella sp. CPCC 100927]|uniref:methyltransferase domain-containing protein n=1 Tax=Reyranella sp. CPCC 100927 TaxID=2599616 RepID=UPI0011B79E63|nr:methyltransferase domain-containing protein [Reyranella sp. CPCC 100927]TWT02631.1 class I SAM-dependent methyltransferase [Reyranella sp. CPCC 100927]